MKIDFTLSTAISTSSRVKQLAAMFDVPAANRSTLRFQGDMPFDAEPWNVGLIVGPSGSGKSSVLQECFGTAADFAWKSAAMIDDFKSDLSITDITAACSAVGFNTVPAWLRPYGVLSNGERFRADLARRLLECPDPILVDEFTSVVDRQVAKIAAHAVAKFIRKYNRQFVAASCHYDVIEWLNPDWIFEPASMRFTRRGVAKRPFCLGELAAFPVPHGASSIGITI